MNFKIHSVFDLPHADPEMSKLPLLGSPWPVHIILVFYLLFVLKLGKIYMKNREPYNVKRVMIIYNSFQVIYNAIDFILIFYYLFIDPTYDLQCMETLPLDSPRKNLERFLTYAYYINKILDLLDTIFFVLRKSYKQITFLHVDHHVFMVCSIYWISRFYGSGAQFTIIAVLNSFVHTVMYFYYLISALKPGLGGKLWWKKYITKIQITQFVLGILPSFWVFLFNPSCKFPIVLQFLILFQGLSFIYMFSNFYVKTYIKPKHQKQK